MPRQVVVVVPPCDIPQTVADDLGIVMLRPSADPDAQAAPDEHKAERSALQPNQSSAGVPYRLVALSRVYTQIMETGLSVLAIQPPLQLDPLTRLALAARSIVSVADCGLNPHPPRVLVYETAAIGQGFAWLAKMAAHAAYEGMGLNQLVALLEDLQHALSAFYFTRWQGPARGPTRDARPHAPLANRLRIGREQLWYLDHSRRQFVCQARGWQLSSRLFEEDGLLGHETMPLLCATDERLQTWVQHAWSQVSTTPLTIEQGGTSLLPLFPQGCVELTFLPTQSFVHHVSAVIRHEAAQPLSAGHGLRQKVGK
jgi:hypothetical protein